MSMLTPPGMGGQYRIKGDRYPRMRRPRNRRKMVLAGMATMLTLGLIGWGTLQLVGVFTGDGGSSAQAADRPGKVCATQDADAVVQAQGNEETSAAGKPGGEPAASPTALPKPSEITVNVLNATPRTGLAARTAEELEKRGFIIGAIANAPEKLDHKVEATALFIGADGADTTAGMKVLATHLEGAKTRHDDRDGKAIDFVIGNDFAGLAKEKAVTKALQALSEPSPAPSPGC